MVGHFGSKDCDIDYFQRICRAAGLLTKSSSLFSSISLRERVRVRGIKMEALAKSLDRLSTEQYLIDSGRGSLSNHLYSESLVGTNL